MDDRRKHTPGPWKFSGFAKASNFADHVACVSGDNTVLARVKGGVTQDRDTAEANSRLIAAAPEMLQELDMRASDLVMLRKAVEAGDPKAELLIRIDDMLRETREVIAKAEGNHDGR